MHHNEIKLEAIKQHLQVARQHQKLDPAATMSTITYIAHVEALLLELDNALIMNELQARNIREYVRQLDKNRLRDKAGSGLRLPEPEPQPQPQPQPQPVTGVLR